MEKYLQLALALTLILLSGIALREWPLTLLAVLCGLLGVVLLGAAIRRLMKKPA